jgi:hypothetical protein
MGGDNEAIKAKELEAQRQVALVVSPVEATTSAPGSLTSGSDHLCADGLPATVATKARVPWRRGPRPCPPTGVRTRPSKNVAATSTVYDVLYYPPAASEQHGRPCRGRYGCGGPAHGTTVTRAVDGRPHPAWRQEATLEAAPNPSKPRSQTRGS